MESWKNPERIPGIDSGGSVDHARTTHVPDHTGDPKNPND